MNPTRFWLLRHAIVAENARTILYGTTARWMSSCAPRV